MAEKYLLFNLDDEKAKSLGDVISNDTSRKIANLLAEKELSETEIAKELNLALNTVEYNLKKLLEAGIIEKSKHYWSVKGKKVETYKVANKLIVISPKRSNIYSKLKGVAPVALISVILTGFIYWYYRFGFIQKSVDKIAETGEKVISPASSLGQEALTETISYVNPWIWFAVGSIVAIIAFIIWNWKRL